MRTAICMIVFVALCCSCSTKQDSIDPKIAKETGKNCDDKYADLKTKFKTSSELRPSQVDKVIEQLEKAQQFCDQGNYQQENEILDELKEKSEYHSIFYGGGQ